MIEVSIDTRHVASKIFTYDRVGTLSVSRNSHKDKVRNVEVSANGKDISPVFHVNEEKHRSVAVTMVIVVSSTVADGTVGRDSTKVFIPTGCNTH